MAQEEPSVVAAMTGDPPEPLAVSGRPLGGKVALVTGAARGQGRAHAVRLARDGADIIALDLAERPAECLEYPPATPDDLAQTGAELAAHGVRVRTARVDTRDFDALVTELDDVVAELGRLDIVVANAGVVTYAPLLETSADQWQTNIDINLTGSWYTARAALPYLLAGGEGGSIVLIGSICAVRTLPLLVAYTAAKHGLLGLAHALALELAPKGIRVNTVNPAGVDTPMSGVDVMTKVREMFEDLPEVAPPRPPLLGGVGGRNGMSAPEDVADAVAFLVSDAAKRITGQDIFVDFGRALI